MDQDVEVEEKSNQNALPPGVNQNLWKFWGQRRYILAFMIMLGEANLYAIRTNLSVAIVSMTEKYNVTIETGQIIEKSDFDWDSKQQGIILGSFFYGYLITQLPGGMLSKWIGSRHVLGIGIAASCLLTLITPLVASSFYAIVTVRVFEGLFSGVVFPAIMGIMSKWAPPLERTRMSSLAFSGSFAGTVIALLGSGLLGEYLGWESIFYVFGALGILWYIAWFFIIEESPETDSRISDAERHYIIQTIGNSVQQTTHVSTPWLSILTSIPVWGIVCAHFTENWGIDTLLTQMPTFLSDTIDLDLSSNGFYSALPYLTIAILMNITGYLADWLQVKRILTTTQVRRYFTSIAFLFQCGFMLMAAFLMSPVWSIFSLTLGVGLAAFPFSGFGVNHLDIAPQHGGILFGLSNTFATIPGIVSPLLTGFLVQNKVIFF